MFKYRNYVCECTLTLSWRPFRSISLSLSPGQTNEIPRGDQAVQLFRIRIRRPEWSRTEYSAILCENVRRWGCNSRTDQTHTG